MAMKHIYRLLLKFLLKKIPKGIYCYDENGRCPYWERKKAGEGYCHVIQKSSYLLWDQCKECGINE